VAVCGGMYVDVHGGYDGGERRWMLGASSGTETVGGPARKRRKPSMETTAGLEVGVLGPLVASRSGRPIPLTPAGRRLLAGLAVVHPGLASTAWLLRAARDADADDPAARQALRSVVRRLRAQIGRDAVVTASEGYGLAPQVQVDLARFVEVAEQGRRLLAAGRFVEAEPVLRSARALWRGPFLVDTHLDDDLPEAASGAVALLGTVTEHWADAAIRCGQPAEIVEVLEGLVRTEPLSEHAWRLLIDACLALDRRDTAARTARSALAVLEDVGVVPGEALRDAIDRALGRGTETAAPVSRSPRARAVTSAVAAEPCLGRDSESEAILDALLSSRDGGVRMIVVAGEPGIGKSHLIAHVAEAAISQGMDAWIGRADPYDRVPYQPVVDVLRQLSAAADAASAGRALSGPLGRLLGGDQPPLRSGLDAISERHELFEAACALIEAATTGAALVGVEDIHWANHDTLLLIRHLVRSRPSLPLCVVLTLRTTEKLTTEVAHVVDELSLLPATTWMRLDGLDVHALAALPAVVRAAAAWGREPHELANAVHRATGGNPLFATHIAREPDGLDVLATLDATDAQTEPTGVGLEDQNGTPLPRRLTYVIDAFLASLSRPTRSALGLAAAQGVEFDAALLAATAGHDTSTALEEAEQAGVIRHCQNGTWHFRHQLIHAALDHGQSRARRAGNHWRVARAIEMHGTRTATTRFALARHYLLARPLAGDELAQRHATQAAEQAETLLDFELAASYLRKAADVASRPHAARLRMRAATALLCSGEVDAARHELRIAAEQAAEAHDPDLLGQAALAAARLPQRLGEPMSPDVRTLVERAAASIDDADVRSELHLYRALDVTRGRDIARLLEAAVTDPVRLIELAERAVWAAAPDGRVELAPLLARADAGTPPPVAAAAAVARWVHAVETGAGSMIEPPDGVAAELDVDAAATPYTSWAWSCWASTRHIAAGRFTDAQIATEAMLASVPAHGTDPELRRGIVATYYGQLAGIETARDPGLVASGPHMSLIDPAWTENPLVWQQLHAAHAAQSGDVERARRLLVSCCEPVLDGQRRTGSLVFQLTLLLRIALSIRDTDRMSRLARALEPWSGWHALFGSSMYLGAVDLTLGLAAVHSGRVAEAADRFEAALDQHRRVGAAAWESATLARLAKTYAKRQRVGDGQAATAAARQARRLGDRLGLPHIARTLASLPAA
jgi:DNA-binding SARP family transcriptional activator